MKKAQGMSLKVVIVAVIALIVLVVLILIFTGKIKFFGTQAGETAAQFTGKRCEVPGTTNQCMDEYECDSKGGSWIPAPPEGFDDEKDAYFKHCPGCCTL
jgi:hypothetical protein